MSIPLSFEFDDLLLLGMCVDFYRISHPGHPSEGDSKRVLESLIKSMKESIPMLAATPEQKAFLVEQIGQIEEDL